MADDGGFGTQNYWMPDPTVGGSTGQILKGSGYVSISIISAHYRTDGNFWQRFFGGSDQVTLSTKIVYSSGAVQTTSASIEDTRQFDVQKPSYFGLGNHQIALKLPVDCDGIEVAVSIAAVQNDNLGAALNLLNSGELKSTLELAPVPAAQSLAIANVVKKLLTSTDPQQTLLGVYGGKVSQNPVAEPVKDACLCIGYLIAIYRESDNDVALDGLDSTKFTIIDNQLKYDGAVLPNSYVVLRYAFDEVRGLDRNADWFSTFSSASTTLDDLETAANDQDRDKIFASSLVLYKQAQKLLFNDPSYTIKEAQSICADQLSKILARRPKPATPASPVAEFVPTKTLPIGLEKLTFGEVSLLGETYRRTLVRNNMAI
jgi:hypothetical protein